MKETKNFADLGLSEPLLRATETLGYETATPIQSEAIPTVLAGRDLIGCAQTGTGKTAAFTLPMLDRLMQSLPPRPPKAQGEKNRRKDRKGARPKPRTVRALVLAPTRELAAQIEKSLQSYGRHTPIRQTAIYGGVSQYRQVQALRHGVDALVATPGRLLDLMEQGYIDLSKIEILVFDEADQMLDMGFLPALKQIVAAVPEERQTLMFSATMPKEIRQLAQQWLTNPASTEIGSVETPVERIAQSVHMVDRKKKAHLLSRFLKKTPESRTLVFSRTKHGADRLVRHLKGEGLTAIAIHGNKSQGARSRALQQFKSKNPPILVATDIAARGLDINSVSHVVNFDLPETPETYVHRIGRTARAGADGVAISLCSRDERGLLRQIERHTKRSISVEPTIEGFETTESPERPKSSQRSRYSKGTKNRRPGGKSRSGSGNRTGSGQSGNSHQESGQANTARRRKKSRRPSDNGATGGSQNRRRRPQTTAT